MNVKVALSFLLAAGVLGLVGCASSTPTPTPTPAPAAKTTAAPGMLNSKCPYSMHAVDGKTTADFNGQKVGFCCGDCKAKFEKSDAKSQADLVAKVKN